MATYFIRSDEGNEHGPYSAAQVKELARAGRINPRASQIRADGSDIWHSANTIKGLFARDLASNDATAAPPLASPKIQDPSPASLPAPLNPGPRTKHVPVLGPLRVEVDEHAITLEATKEPYNIHVDEEWATPSGRQRSSPVYTATVYNEYLNKVRHLKKSNLDEISSLIHEQIEKWKLQEIKQRVEEQRRILTEEVQKNAALLTERARDTITSLNTLLVQAVAATPALDWSEYVDRRRYHDFSYSDPPEPSQPPRRPLPPKKNFFHSLLPFLWHKRTRRFQNELISWQWAVDQCEIRSQEERAAWEAGRDTALAKHKRAEAEFLRKQTTRNKAVARFRAQLDKNDPSAVMRYVEEVVTRAKYPPGLSASPSVNYDAASQTVVVDIQLPLEHDLPDIVGYKFVKSSGEATPVCMKPHEHEELYDSVVKQVVLRTLFDVFAAMRTPLIEGAVANGWVTFLDKATGHKKTTCIISVSCDRERFVALDLQHVDPTECIKSLKGLIAGPMSQIAPVQPIMHLDRADGRFVESQAVLAEMNATTNLVEIGWEEFEHLVRELFQKMFSEGGAEVRVTQASSDGGVDAIAFDPDPIRGGKFVIQAKRYINVVPVSAVRDLYGTMIAEGAAKGILVTTAHYGRDSREFVKDKPISLIDGANLVYLLEEYGHKVRIDVEAVRRNDDRNPLAR